MNKVRIFLASLFAVLTGTAIAGIASAAPPEDPTGGAMADVQSGVEGWVTTYGVPALVALLLLGIVIGVFVRFSRNAANKVSGK